jgi:PEP-CTERM motif
LKTPTLTVAAIVAVACSGLAHANVTPTSKLYITGNTPNGGGEQILVVQGQSTIISADTAYSQNEWPIAIYGDVRTAGSSSSNDGGFYDLSVSASPYVHYQLPSFMVAVYDSTSDGTHNYMVDFASGIVYQTDRTYGSAGILFQIEDGNLWSGITYDPANQSLWLVAHESNVMANYSLNGKLLSSFSVQTSTNGPLAFDPADQTLWLINYGTKNLEQYSTSGQFLGIDPGYWGIGAEFNLETIGLSPTPEPGTLILFASGILGLAGILHRKINP